MRGVVFSCGSAGLKGSHLGAVRRSRVHEERAAGVLSPHNVAVLCRHAWSQTKAAH